MQNKWRMGGETSARSRSLYFVKEDEDRGEMREVTYEGRGSARTIPIRVKMGPGQLTQKSEDVH